MEKIEDLSFAARLENTIQEARDRQCTAAFLTIPMSKSSLIEPAGKLGFRYHHAEGDTAKLYLWLKSEEDKIPEFGTHSCGVGGVVMLSGTNKILVIKERHPHNANWKLPGGYANLGEDFSEAVEREVWEETGVRGRYQSLLALRHSHQQQFGRSNLYVVCLLEANEELIVVDPEIEEARWMEVEEYRKTCGEHSMNRLVADLVLQHKEGGCVKELGLKETTFQSVLSGPLPYQLYHI